MLRTTRRPALIAACGLTMLLVLYVPAAQAASPATATTLRATFVTATSAQLNGSINTGGQATEWQFQYGRTTRYGKTTMLSAISAGLGTVSVSATILGLSPKTTYHFRVLAVTGIGSHYLETDYGADRSFTTKPATGKLRLVSGKLAVSSGLVTVSLKCKSKLACHGSFSITTLAGRKAAGSICATGSFRIPAGSTLKVQSKVSSACLALLRTAPGHRIKATFSSWTTTSQLGQTKTVTLILV